jgi:hypothetical protein
VGSPTIAAAIEVLRQLAAQLERHQRATSGACFARPRADERAWCGTHDQAAVWSGAWACPVSHCTLADPIARPAPAMLVATIDEAAGLLQAARARLAPTPEGERG